MRERETGTMAQEATLGVAHRPRLPRRALLYAVVGLVLVVMFPFLLVVADVLPLESGTSS